LTISADAAYTVGTAGSAAVNIADNDGANQAPTAEAGGPYAGDVGATIALDGSASSDTDGSIVLYEWDLDNDGQYDDATGQAADFSSATAGTFTVGLRVTDDDGDTGTDTATVLAAAQTDQTVGLLVYDEQLSYDGYTLFAPKHNTNTYLIDNYGRVVHSWTASTYEPGQSVYLKENGNLVRSCFTHAGSMGGGEGGRIEEYDWDGNLVWELDWATDDYVSHHDIELLPNGNILMLVVQKKTYAEVLAAGFDPSLLSGNVQSDGYLLPDSVVEIEPTGSSGGNVVWEWHVWDHLIQDFNPARDNYGVVADHPELIDPNGSIGGGRAISQFWNHMNS
ncbi:MAG: PKD domain-containing protein, partial [Actinomycetia bacterium]|nr:PKD domain-containing protein [Actinomycetes bacterium]